MNGRLLVKPRCLIARRLERFRDRRMRFRYPVFTCTLSSALAAVDVLPIPELML